MWPSWDEALFRWIHLGWHQPWLDPVMYALTDPGRWKLPLLVLIGAIFLLRRARGAIALLVLAMTIAASDQLSSHILKPVFRRVRPSTLAGTKPLFGIRHSYSFPSTHAANFSAAAPLTAEVFPSVAPLCYAYAAAVGLSRIYVGDHYPVDVLGGTMLGLFLGFLGRKAFRRAAVTLLGSSRAAAPDEIEGEPAIPATPSRAGPAEELPSGGR